MDSILIPPQGKFKKFIFQIINSSFFEFLILMFIIGNIVILALNYDEQPADYTEKLNNANLVFTIVFIVEAVIKMYALSISKYFQSGWNQ